MRAAADIQRIGWIGLGKMGLPICAEGVRYLKLVLNMLAGGTSALLAEALMMGRKAVGARLR